MSHERGCQDRIAAIADAREMEATTATLPRRNESTKTNGGPVAPRNARAVMRGRRSRARAASDPRARQSRRPLITTRRPFRPATRPGTVGVVAQAPSRGTLMSCVPRAGPHSATASVRLRSTSFLRCEPVISVPSVRYRSFCVSCPLTGVIGAVTICICEMGCSRKCKKKAPDARVIRRPWRIGEEEEVR